MNKKFVNRLNNLDPKTWIKFQKSWFVHNPPRRGKDVLSHPAKFPETIAQEFIEFFTKHEQNVLDPMVGTGSTLLGALRSGRNSFGVELNKHYSDIAAKVVKEGNVPKVKYSIHDARTPAMLHFLRFLDKARSKPRPWYQAGIWPQRFAIAT